MSSNSYSTELTPDPLLRRVVIIAGLSMTIFGLIMILALPVALLWRGCGAILWLLISTQQYRVIARGYKRCQHIRLEHNGYLQVTAPDGCCLPATLCAGSIVLARFAWLRFRAENGQHFVELLRGESPGNKDWRRLQVIWRHLGAGR